MQLRQVLDLKVGDQIVLSSTPGAPVCLRCGEVALFQAQLGKRGSRLAVRIETARPPLPVTTEQAA
jgi:flagellar motor switch protein FliM